jgi:hypothetical protein
MKRRATSANSLQFYATSTRIWYAVDTHSLADFSVVRLQELHLQNNRLRSVEEGIACALRAETMTGDNK